MNMVGQSTVDNVLVMPKLKEVLDWLNEQDFEWCVDFEEREIVHVQFREDSDLEKAKNFIFKFLDK